MNNVSLVGRITKDPELRYTPDGTPTATFTLAINRPFKNAKGDNEADFVNCVVWRKPAENAANYLKKGSLTGVNGRIQTRNYEGQDGKRVYVTEVVAENVEFLERRSDNTDRNEQSNTNTSGNSKNTYSGQQTRNYTRVDDDPFKNDGKIIDISDDDLPF